MKYFNILAKKSGFLLLMLITSITALAQPLAGIYTVGGATPSYTTLTAAVNDLIARGVSAPVTFNLRTGTYSGANYSITAITGASVANKIVFQSETGLPANVTISYASSGSNDNYIFQLDDASFITFKDLTIENTASADYACGIQLLNASSDNSIVNCIFNSSIAGSTSTDAALIYADAFIGSNIRIMNSTFTGGSYGVYLSGSSTADFSNNTIIQDNTFTDQSYYGVYNNYGNNLSVINNTISTTTQEYTGIYCYGSEGAITIGGNTITVNTDDWFTAYGVYVEDCYGTSGDPVKIENNTIAVTNTSSGSTYGIYTYGVEYNSILTNTITTSSIDGWNDPLYNSSSPNSYISANNIVSTSDFAPTEISTLDSSPDSYFGENTIDITSGSDVYHWGISSGSDNSTMYKNTITINGTLDWGGIYNYMAQDADNPTVRKNTINITAPGYIETYCGYYNSNVTIDSNNFTIVGNGVSTFNDNYNYMGYGVSGGTISDNIVDMNSSYNVYPMYAESASDLVISRNNFKGIVGNDGWGATGVYLYGSYNVQFVNNKVVAKCIVGWPSVVGLMCAQSEDIQVMNNAITSLGNNNSWNQGISMEEAINGKFLNNTIYNVGQGAAISADNWSPNPGFASTLVQNNVAISTSGSAYSTSMQNGTLYTSDYNLFYSPSNVFYNSNMGTGMSLATWRSTNNLDRNSLQYNAMAAFPNRANGDLTPDAAEPAVWALNGRAVHTSDVPEDITGITRPATRPVGVPDLGAYEVLPTSIPPDAVANPAAPSPGLQYFTFGQDTVAVIDWGTTTPLPATATVKQYSGEAPASFAFPFYMYFHTDIDVPAGSYNHTANIYYKDIWTGTTAAESGLRLVKKLGAGAWTPYSSPQSATNPTRNIISTSNLTDFGQHTGSDVSNNASVSELTAPTPTFCAPSTQTLKVKVKNTGNNVINGVNVDWYMDGLLQGTVSTSATINTFFNQPDFVEITLGTYNFTSSRPVRLVAFSYLPNGVDDAAHGDDTLKVIITPGLNGEYTVGGTPTPDFVDVKEAVDILNMWGVCGPTVFKIRDSVGAYQGAGIIKAPIVGGSTTNRVTFRSESGNAANVVINATSLAPVFGLNDVTDVTIKNVKIVGNGNTTISMAGSPQRDTIMGCIIQAPASTQWQQEFGVISSMNYDFNGRDNAFIKNTLTGAVSGIALLGPGYNDAINNVIDSNIFSNHGNYGISTNGLLSSKIRGNTLNDLLMPLDIYSTTTADDAIEIIGNTINNTRPDWINNSIVGTQGTSDIRAKIAYNKISATSNSFYNDMLSQSEYVDVYNNNIRMNVTEGEGIGTQYDNVSYANVFNNVIDITYSATWGNGLVMADGFYEANKIYNNTVVIKAPSLISAARIGFGSSSSDNEIYNNVFANLGVGGNALDWSNNGTNNQSDYNNIFSSNGNHFIANNTADTSLDHWRSTQDQEKNSICYNPGLMGLGDLHPDAANPASWSLNGRGKHIAGNVVDRDGNARETDITLGVPDIGAYEFEPTVEPPLARAVPAALPAAGTTQVFTFGQDTVVTLTWNPMTIVSNTIEVRQYSGRKGPSYPSGLNNMYFYTNVLTQNVSADYTANVYYKDIWMGTIASEPDLRMLKKVNPNPWVAYNDVLSSSDNGRNIITANDLTSTGMFTGVENGGLFSAVITPNGSSTFCSGGSVQLDANVGVGYTYQWYKNGILIPGATNKSYTATMAGDYTVQVTDPNALPSVLTATSVAVGVAAIAAPSAVISASGPLTYCTGGSLTLMANTGLNLWYQWQFNGNNIPGANQPNLDVTASGNYTVTVNNIGCATTSPITTINAGPLHVALGDDTSFCESKVLVLDAGYPGAHYLWSTGDTTQTISITTVSGDYSVLVDAGPNCQAKDTISVHIDPLPSMIGISYISMGGSTFQFSPSGAANVTSYMWMYSDGTVDFNATTTHTFPATGDWIATLIAFNDCGTDTSILDLRALNVANVEQSNFNLYPNPATEQVTLSADKVKLSEVLIINNLGQVVYRGTEDKVRSTTIDVKGLVDGHYIIRANTSDGKIISKPFDVLK